jgi:nucleoside-diphosphate-sugar epimerase
MGRLFCFGMGFCATALVRRLPADSWTATGTARSAARVDELRRAGFDACRFDDVAPDTLGGTTHALISTPPGTAGDPVLHAHRAGLASLLPKLRWLGYLSTTGVYGDQNGNWVDETSPTVPTSERARNRVKAEQDWLAWGHGANVPVQIFRLAGIYGPGRSQLDSVRAGTARCIVRPGQVFSRIHVDDVAETLMMSMAKPNPGRIYNVCDNEPAPPHEVVDFACTLLGREPPAIEPYEAASKTMSDMALSFWQDSKRVSNQRICHELNVQLQYPTYREGLTSILAGMSPRHTALDTPHAP